MTVKLTGNFLATARCLIYLDGNAITWTFDPNTNELTAAYTGAGSAGSHNPTASIGLTAVNGTATTWMTSDSAPALSQAIVPTWSGKHIFTPSTSVTAITVNANGANPSAAFIGAGTVPLTIQEMTALPNNVLSAYIGVASAAFPGSGINGDLVLCPRTSNDCSINLCTGNAGAAVVRLSIAGTGAAVFSGAVGVNGNAAPAKVTGWGTPTNQAVVANYNASAATLLQTADAVAQIITDLKAFGLYGA